MVKIMENPIKMDDLGVPLFLETPILWEPKGTPAIAPNALLGPYFLGGVVLGGVGTLRLP